MSTFTPVPIEQEPKRNNRFVVEFPEEFGIESYVVQSITRPKLNINQVEIPYMNTTYNTPGKYFWEDFEITFIDIIGPSTTRGIMNMIAYCQKQKAYFLKRELEGEESLKSKVLFTFQLKSLNPVGEEIEQWTIEVQELMYVDFGRNDYSDDNMQTIIIKLKPGKCILNH